MCRNYSTISSPQVPYDPPLSPHAQQYLGASGRFESRKMFAQQNNRYGSPIQAAIKPQPYQTPSKFKMFWEVKSANEILLFITLRLPITVVFISQLESHGHGWRGKVWTLVTRLDHWWAFCLPICLLVCLFVCASVRLSCPLSFCPSVCLSVCRSMSICLPVCLSACLLCTCLSAWRID